MKRTLLAFTLVAATMLLSSCGVDSKHFKIEGHLLHINQGEFYVYNDEGAVNGIDTIKVEGGRFALELPCEQATTLMLVFPNFSEIPIFAEPGKDVEIKGDVSHLKELKIKGTKDNELMSKFREQIASASPPEIRKYASQFIADHPESPVGVYLVQKYFVTDPVPDYTEASKLVTLMKAEQPKNGRLARLVRAVNLLDKSGTGKKVPAFTVYDDRGRLVSSSDVSTGLAVVVCWASWSYDSMNQLRQLKQLQRSSAGRLKVVAVSVDASRTDCKNAVRMDSLTWPNVCDGEMFDNKINQALGLFMVPDNVVIKDGRIVARGLTTSELEQKIKTYL